MNETLNQTLNESINQIVTQNVYKGVTIPFTSYPALDIFIITFFVALFITLVNKYMTDQITIKALRNDMKELQKKFKETMAKDPAKAQKIQQEIMKKSFENLKHSMNMKVMLVTMVPILLVFSVVAQAYGPFGEFLHLLPFWEWTNWGWLGTYIFFSIINSIILKKVLDVA